MDTETRKGLPEPEQCCYVRADPAYFEGRYYSLPGKPCGRRAEWAIHERGEPYDIVTYACDEHVGVLLGHEGGDEPSSMVFEVWPVDNDSPFTPEFVAKSGGERGETYTGNEPLYGESEDEPRRCAVCEAPESKVVVLGYCPGCGHDVCAGCSVFTATGMKHDIEDHALYEYHRGRPGEEESKGFCCASHEALYHILRALEIAGGIIKDESEVLTKEHFDEEIAEEMRDEARQEEIGYIVEPEELLACEVCGGGGLTREDDYCWGCGHIVCLRCGQRAPLGKHFLGDHCRDY